MTTVLLDPSLGRALPHSLKQLGVEVEAHADHFPAGTPDDAPHLDLPAGAPALGEALLPPFQAWRREWF